MSVNTASTTETVEHIRTSRIGRKPVAVPAGVEAKMQGLQLVIKGPKGQLVLDIHPYVDLKIVDKHIELSPKDEASVNCRGTQVKLYRSITGTMRAQIANMVHGVTQGFELKLLLVGVGYRAQMKGKVLALSLGFSHPVDVDVPEGLMIETPTQTEIIIKGANKEVVGLIAAQIRMLRPPEPYKGKGIRYYNERIILKETKKK